MYDIEHQTWKLLGEISVNEKTSFLESSLTNEYLEASEIVRLNSDALNIEEIRSFLENEVRVAFTLPDSAKVSSESIRTTAAASFKLSHYFLQYLMGYKKNILLFSTR